MRPEAKGPISEGLDNVASSCTVETFIINSDFDTNHRYIIIGIEELQMSVESIES